MKSEKKRFGIFDVHSIIFRVWLYFVAFATCLLLALWGLQIFFLNTYYQDMKIEETNRVAKVITEQYKNENIIDIVRNLTYSNDMYIHIETADGTIVFSPTTEEGRRPSYGYIGEMEAMKESLLESGKESISSLIPEGRTDMNTLSYAGFVEDAEGKHAVLYIFSPLYPVSSTVLILKEQLKYITVIALALAFGISIYLAIRISKPIRRITRQAEDLATGDYGKTFMGGRYSEITNLSETLTHASKELAKSDRLQKDIIANVSHDIRTPLTMIKSYAELIRDISGQDKEKREEHLKTIIEEADRLNLLVSDMLTLSQIQAGVSILAVSEFDFGQTIRTVVNPYLEILTGQSFDISIKSEKDLWLTADQARIRQVISNLFSNAVKYSGDEKYILIRSFKTENMARFEIEDKGPGIAEEDLDRIWDRYHKGNDDQVGKVAGTGLGLAIVKEVILLHKGKYGAENKAGGGSIFYFEIPIFPEE